MAVQGYEEKRLSRSIEKVLPPGEILVGPLRWMLVSAIVVGLVAYSMSPADALSDFAKILFGAVASLLTLIISFLVFYGWIVPKELDSEQYDEIKSLNNRIEQLESELANYKLLGKTPETELLPLSIDGVVGDFYDFYGAARGIWRKCKDVDEQHWLFMAGKASAVQESFILFHLAYWAKKGELGLRVLIEDSPSYEPLPQSYKWHKEKKEFYTLPHGATSGSDAKFNLKRILISKQGVDELLGCIAQGSVRNSRFRLVEDDDQEVS